MHKKTIIKLLDLSEIEFTTSQLDQIYAILGNYKSAEKNVFTTKITKLINEEKYHSFENSKNIKECVDENEIRELLSEVSGVPVSSITSTESEKLLSLENILQGRVIGQKEAISSISKAIRRSRVGIQNPNRPIASFFFCGPTGVGKTEVTKALATIMFGSENEMIRFDMSEFMEKHNLSRLIGSPPGYVGYGEGGQLTDAVLKKPYSLVLFDEVEKAHPEILNILLQILEDGRLTDTSKKLVSFENTIIVMTSNAASEDIQEILRRNPKKEDEEFFKIGDESDKKGILEICEKNQEIDEILSFESEETKINKIKKLNKEFSEQKQLKEEVLKSLGLLFLPEFLNRLDDIIVFLPLKPRELRQICDLMINSLITRAQEKNIKLSISDKVKFKLTKESYNPKFGARPLRRSITKSLEDLIADRVLRNQKYNITAKNFEIKIDLNALNEIYVIN